MSWSLRCRTVAALPGGHLLVYGGRDISLEDEPRGHRWAFDLSAGNGGPIRCPMGRGESACSNACLSLDAGAPHRPQTPPQSGECNRPKGPAGRPHGRLTRADGFAVVKRGRWARLFSPIDRRRGRDGGSRRPRRWGSASRGRSRWRRAGRGSRPGSRRSRTRR